MGGYNEGNFSVMFAMFTVITIQIEDPLRELVLYLEDILLDVEELILEIAEELQ